MMPQPPPRHECDKQRTAPSDNGRGVRNGGQCSDSDSAGSEHSLFDDVEFDSSPNGDSAAGTAATDWSTSCGMPGCAFSHAPQAVATGASVRARMNAHERAMSSWVRHFNGSHREQQRDFLRVHRLRPWARLMEYCAPCGTLCSKHNIAAHRSGKRHMQRLLDAQRAARASEADAASGRRVQPTSNVEPVLGPDSYQWDLAAGSAGRVALDALSVDTILATQLVTFRKSLKGGQTLLPQHCGSYFATCMQRQRSGQSYAQPWVTVILVLLPPAQRRMPGLSCCSSCLLCSWLQTDAAAACLGSHSSLLGDGSHS